MNFSCSHGYLVGCRLAVSRHKYEGRRRFLAEAYPSSTGVMAYTFRPKRWWYHPTEPTAAAVAAQPARVNRKGDSEAPAAAPDDEEVAER